MRPVVIAGAGPPLQYSTNKQLEAPAYRGYDVDLRERWEDMIKADVIGKLHALINAWVTGGAPLTPQGTPAFPKDSPEESNYKEYTALLFQGGKGLGWGAARRDLIGQIGQYCSYCGSPIFSHLHIEHVLPKSFFPDHIFEWSNFLLACASCNSAKSNAPNQATVPRSRKLTADSVAYITNQNSMEYLWPFYDWSSFPQDPGYPFRFLLCHMGVPKGGRAKTLRFLDEINWPTAAGLMNLLERGELRQERSLYFYTRDNAKQYIGVKVEVVEAEVRRVPRLWLAADRLVDLANLNTVLKSSDSAKSVDFRIFNRTTAYLRALLLRHRLAAACEAGDAALFTSLVEVAKITVKNTGFWPVWAQVLGNLDLNGVQTQAFLRDIFPGTSAVTWTFPYLPS
jgi:hypothetical protein